MENRRHNQNCPGRIAREAGFTLVEVMISSVITLLAENVAQLTFSLYDVAGNVTTQASAQIDVVLQKNVQGKNRIAEFLSARLRMRNAP